MLKLALTISLFTAGMLAACQSPMSVMPQKPSTLFAATWNSGAERSEPAFHIQKINEDTVALRQSLRTTFEAPFVYLIFGEARALLIDTGDKGANLRGEIDGVIDEWLTVNKRDSIALTVMHSHGHNDHISGDSGFEGRARTEIVGHSPEEVREFFGMSDEPTASVKYDLGSRVVEILPTPGHHPAHVMVFDPATQIMFTGDTIYPGRLYFKCEKLSDFSAAIDKVADFTDTHDVKWLLGGHIEMKAAPGELFPQHAKSRSGEHLLELPVSIIGKIQSALAEISDKPVVTEHDEFALVPHPADPSGKRPPNWCLADH